MSKWKLPTAKVTLGENEQEVRSLTHKERTEMTVISREIKEGKKSNADVMNFVLASGCVGLSPDDIQGMPADLADQCGDKILELSGLELKKAEPATPAS